MNPVESCSAQKLRSSCSERNSGTCFFVLGMGFAREFGDAVYRQYKWFM
jgi:hypothetical protein